MPELTEEQRLHARDVHNDYFRKTYEAIEHGFYLEAILLEYSAMESRMAVIMSILQRPCALCKDTSITNKIGLATKLKCYKELYNKNPTFFKESMIKKSMLTKMIDWCNSRNARIHGLYSNTEKYEKLMNKNKRLAEDGYYYALVLYDEAKRLRKINRYYHDQLTALTDICTEPYEDCNKAKEWAAANSTES